MKKLSILFASIFAIIAVNAQQGRQGMSVVTINVNGNSNLQLSVDGSTYTLPVTTTTGISTASINSLAAGQHTLLITRSGQNGYHNNNNDNRSENINTTFNLRSRYDMKINVNADGSLELIETARSRNGGNQGHISNAAFNTLWQTVRSQRSMDQRRTLISNSFSTTASGDRSNYFTSVQVAQLLQLLTNESYKLQLAKQSYAYVVDPLSFNRVSAVLTSQASRNELNAYVNSYNNGDVTTNDVNTTTTTNVAMSDASFNSMYQTARQQWPSSTQFNTISEAFTNSNNYFTTAQAMQLIQLSNFEANRLQLAKASYRSIVDPYNFSQVYNLLNTQSSKDELASYVSNYRPGTVYNNNTGTINTNTHIAMSDAEYSSLIQSVRYKFLPGEKMNSLITIFNSNSNYFTSVQAKQLIELVSAESNRLQLAKSAYRTVVDRTNFKTIYDLLDSQSSRNELDAYIYAYRD